MRLYLPTTAEDDGDGLLPRCTEPRLGTQASVDAGSDAKRGRSLSVRGFTQELGDELHDPHEV